MKSIISKVFYLLLICSITIVAISANVTATSMSGSCYIEVTQTVEYTERWYDGNNSSDTFPMTTTVSGVMKNGHSHSGTLSFVSRGEGVLENSYNDGGYTVYKYSVEVTYGGMLSCDGDTSEASINNQP